MFNKMKELENRACLFVKPDQTWFMKMVNIQAAKTHLSRLVEEAAAGADIVLAKAGKPIVRLMPFEGAKGARKLGFLSGEGHEIPGCWDSDPEMEALFYESETWPAARVAEEPQK